MKSKKTYRFVLIMLSLAFAISACSASDIRNANDAESEQNPILQNFNPAISVTGKAVPLQWATLSIPTGGIVINMAVAENDLVKKGQVLLQVSGAERLEAAIKAATLELISAQLAYDDLFEFQATSKALVGQSIAILRDVVNDTEVRLNNLNYAVSQDDIDTAFASLVLAEDHLDKAKDYFEKYENKSETSVQRANALIALNQAENAYDSVLRTYNYVNGSVSEYEIGKAEANLALATNQLADSERKLEQMQNSPDPDVLILAEARLANAKAQVNAAQASLDDLQLIAPFSGTIGQINIRENEWVNPGQPLIVMGDLSVLQIETTNLNEIDVARIYSGIEATVTFDSLPSQSVKATVIKIATKANPGVGVNYTVILELSEIPEDLLWDMTAYVDIQIDG